MAALSPSGLQQNYDVFFFHFLARAFSFQRPAYAAVRAACTTMTNDDRDTPWVGAGCWCLCWVSCGCFLLAFGVGEGACLRAPTGRNSCRRRGSARAPLHVQIEEEGWGWAR
jgi:hypothetical protein